MRTVVYTRVSKDPNGRAESVDQQEAELLSVASDEGWTVEAVYRDPDRSASRYATKSRPGFDAMCEHLRTRPVDVLMLWEPSRLSRTMSTAVELRDLCRVRRVRIWFDGRLYSMANANDSHNFTEAMSDAEHESNKTSSRIKRHVRARAAAGAPHGRNTWGLRRVYATTGERRLERVEIDPEPAAMIRDMARRVLDGESCYAIALDLTERGVPSPRGAVTWHPATITRLLMNPTYAGKRVHRYDNGDHVVTEVHDAAWPAIFDEITWARLQNVLGDPARSTRREGAVAHLLTGIATCGECGGYISTAKQNGGVRRDGTRITYRSYSCRGKKPTPDNPNPRRFCATRRVDLTDQWVEAVVKAKLAQPDALAAFEDQPDDAELGKVLEEIAALTTRLESFTADAVAGTISPGTLAKVEAGIREQIAVQEAKRLRLSRPSVLRDNDPATIAAEWDGWDVHRKRQVLRALFDVKIHSVDRRRKNPREFDPDSVTVELRAQSR